MKIVLDVGGALGPPSGVRRYVEQLLQGFADIDNDNEYLVYAAYWTGYPDRLRQFRVPKKPNFKIVSRRLPQRWLVFAEEKLGMALQERFLLEHKPDIVHGLVNAIPRLSQILSVVTLHHVGGMPDNAGAWEDLYFNKLPSRAARKADRVIAISEFTRQEAIRQLQVPPEKIQTIWYGGASSPFKEPFNPDVLTRLKLSRPYILFVSALNARKNLLCLLEAFRQLREAGRPHHLVLAGHKADAYEPLVRESQRMGLFESLIFLEGLDEITLNSVYRGADLFVYPSLLEGFGLPVVEAMTCGTPVVAARAASLPEIAQDAALYFNGKDSGELSRQMEYAFSDKALREDLIKKGIERARAFDWHMSARQTLNLYKALAAQRAAVR